MENLKKKAKCWLVPTEDNIQIGSVCLDPTFGLGIIKEIDGEECFYNTHESGGSITTPYKRNLKDRLKHFNLYITSDEEIKEGDWCLYHNRFGSLLVCKAKDTEEGRVYQEIGNPIDNYGYIDGGITPLKDEISKIIILTDKSLNLPQPSQGFINAYIEAYNKRQQVVDVNIDYKGIYSDLDDIEPCFLKLKTDSNNCATITKTKDSWSREEVIELLHKAFKAQSFDFDNNLDRISLNNWIEQNI